MQSPGGPLILVKFLKVRPYTNAFNVNESLLPKTLVAIQILWAVSLMFIKVSILLFYVSIFDVPMFKTLAKMALVLVVLWCSSVILCAFLLCRPFAFK